MPLHVPERSRRPPAIGRVGRLPAPQRSSRSGSSQSWRFSGSCCPTLSLRKADPGFKGLTWWWARRRRPTLEAPTRYNFSPQSVSGGLKLDDKVFQIQTSGGAIVPAGSDWKVEILGITGTPIGNDTYSLQNESWYATASTPLASGETISLESAGTVLNGNNLDVLGKGPYQGSVSVEIPSVRGPHRVRPRETPDGSCGWRLGT